MLIQGSNYGLMANLSDQINFDRKGGGNKADGSKKMGIGALKII